jgi:SAM-dependent methyltransferase
MPITLLWVLLKTKMVSCLFCKNESFIGHANFSGTTELYAGQTFTYAKCTTCDTLCNVTTQDIDYSNYGSGKKIFKLRTLRYIRLLNSSGITTSDSILDYGCGSGAFTFALRNHGYQNVSGYEPFNPEFKDTLQNGKTYSVVYLTHVFEHIPDYTTFFANLKKVTKPGSKVITIHPSSTRMPALDPQDALQCWTFNSPYHVVIPSDKATLDLFQKNGFRLVKHLPYDIQRSGFKDNNRVSSLLFKKLGGTRQNLINATERQKKLVCLKSFPAFIDAMFVRTKDIYVSTFVFERVK